MDDLRPEERVESAEFAPSRVGGRARRGRSLLVLLAWLSAIGVIVAIAILHPASNADRPASATQTPNRLGQMAPSASPAPLAFVASRDSAGITVVGTVAARPTVRVLVIVRSVSGDVSAWRSVTFADPGDDLRPNRPTFDISIPVPAEADGRAIAVEVSAYDGNGGTLGAAGATVASFAADPTRGRELRLACC